MVAQAWAIWQQLLGFPDKPFTVCARVDSPEAQTLQAPVVAVAGNYLDGVGIKLFHLIGKGGQSSPYTDRRFL